jgi:hypothetical protein
MSLVIHISLLYIVSFEEGRWSFARAYILLATYIRFHCFLALINYKVINSLFYKKKYIQTLTFCIIS